jgi:sigma-B regulation protein RsbU (phosphoserine phosphatase)
VTLRARIVGLLVVLATIMLGSAVAVGRALAQFDDQRVLLIDQLQPAVGNARDLLTSLVNQETGERGYVITADPGFLEPYRRGQDAARAEIRDLRRELPDDAEVHRSLDDVNAAILQWQRNAVRRELAATQSGDREEAERLVRTGAGKRSFDRIRLTVEELQTLIDERVAEAQAEGGRTLDRVRNTLAVTAVLLLALLVVSGLLLRQWVLVPVERLLASMRAVADGDVSRPVVGTGPPEVAAIGRGAEEMRRRIVSELDAARSATEALDQHSPVVAGLQRELTPSSADGLEGVAVHGVLHAAEGVLAGDWWDVVRRPDGRTVLLIADVSGHGPDACLVAARFKQRLTLLLRSPAGLLTAFEYAARDLDADPERFLSCALVEVDPGTGGLRWINAGHGGAMVLRRHRSVVEGRELAPTGPLIGAMAQEWTVEQTLLAPDQMVVLATDGITEARQSGEGEFGTEGVFSAARTAPTWRPADVVPEVVEAVRQFADDWRRDDATCVALMLSPGGGTTEAPAGEDSAGHVTSPVRGR